MANHEDSGHGRNSNGITPAGRGPGYTEVSSRLHGAARDVSELLDLLNAGLAADESIAASSVYGEDDAVEPGDRRQVNGERGSSR